MCKEGHEKLQKEIQMLLEKYHDTGKIRIQWRRVCRGLKPM